MARQRKMRGGADLKGMCPSHRYEFGFSVCIETGIVQIG